MAAAVGEVLGLEQEILSNCELQPVHLENLQSGSPYEVRLTVCNGYLRQEGGETEVGFCMPIFRLWN